MRYRVSRIDAAQFGKLSAVMYGSMALAFALFVVLMGLMASHLPPPPLPPASLAPHAPLPPPHGFPWWLGLAFPVLYAVMGFAFSWGLAAIYNLAARWVGGIEITLEQQPGDDAA